MLVGEMNQCLFFYDQLATLTNEDIIIIIKEFIQIQTMLYSLVSAYLLHINPGGIIYMPTYTKIR